MVPPRSVLRSSQWICKATSRPCDSVPIHLTLRSPTRMEANPNKLMQVSLSGRWCFLFPYGWLHYGPNIWGGQFRTGWMPKKGACISPYLPPQQGCHNSQRNMDCLGLVVLGWFPHLPIQVSPFPMGPYLLFLNFYGDHMAQAPLYWPCQLIPPKREKNCKVVNKSMP